mmetsp:Transcript_22988/g.39471  ORF Transcript_22988/g.39471 Transcript_22988/m.39471 type:complete len:122 (-) Transcript_22988:530-895(-)
MSKVGTMMVPEPIPRNPDAKPAQHPAIMRGSITLGPMLFTAEKISIGSNVTMLDAARLLKDDISSWRIGTITAAKMRKKPNQRFSVEAFTFAVVRAPNQQATDAQGTKTEAQAKSTFPRVR